MELLHFSGENLGEDVPRYLLTGARTNGNLAGDYILPEVQEEIKLAGALRPAPFTEGSIMERDPQETLQEVAAALGWDTAAMLLVCLNFFSSQGHEMRQAFAVYVDTIRTEEEAWNVLPANHQGA